MRTYEAYGDDGKDVSMAAISNLLEVARFEDFKTTMSTLEIKLDQIQATVMEHA